MKKIILLNILIIIWIQTGFSQKPTWINETERNKQFAAKEYLTSFLAEGDVVAQNLSTREQALKVAIGRQMASMLTIKIEQQATTKAVPYTSTNILSKTIATLTQFQKHYDAEKKLLYVLAYVKRKDLLSDFQKQWKQSLSGVTVSLKKSENKLQQKYYQDALSACVEGFVFLRKMEYACLAIGVLDAGVSPSFNVLAAQQKKLNIQLREIQKYKTNDIDKVARFIAQTLARQVSKLEKPVQLSNFTYQNSGINSQFSRMFYPILTKKLKETGYELAEVKNAVLYDAYQRNTYQLKGNYQEDNITGQLRIVVWLQDGKTGQTLASLDAYMDQKALKNQKIRFKPANYQKALEQIKIFNQHQSPTRGGLLVDVWTNKGKQNPIFVKGDEVKFYVKANKPCYLRFIYHLSDGSTVLLLDNYYIGQSKVNQVYEIPQVFECDAPYGVEILHLNAQSRQFGNISVKKQQGYSVIMSDLSEILKSSRVLPGQTIKAQTKVLITTLER